MVVLTKVCWVMNTGRWRYEGCTVTSTSSVFGARVGLQMSITLPRSSILDGQTASEKQSLQES